MAPVLVSLNDLEGHFPRSRLQAFLSPIRRTRVQHFTRFQLTALNDQLSPKWGWLRLSSCSLQFGIASDCFDCRRHWFKITQTESKEITVIFDLSLIP